MNQLQLYVFKDTLFLILIMRSVGLTDRVISTLLNMHLIEFQNTIRTYRYQGYLAYCRHYAIIDEIYMLANHIGISRKTLQDTVISYLVYGKNSVYALLEMLAHYIAYLQAIGQINVKSYKPLFNYDQFNLLWIGMIPAIYLNKN